MDGNLKQLKAHLKAEYTALDDKGEEVIYPYRLAQTVYRKFVNPKHKHDIPAMAEAAILAYLRTLAGQVCRTRLGKFDDLEEEDGQENLFDFELQPRYPVEREEGLSGYWLRESLSYGERMEIEERMRKAGKALVRHADEFGQETRDLVKRGILKIPRKTA